jgi:hypothetical protein
MLLSEAEMTIDNSAEMARILLAEARADVAQADQKASLLLAALGVGLGAILGGQLSTGWTPFSLSTPGQVVWWTGIVIAIIGVAGAAIAVWPRFSLAQGENGITYWGHAAGEKSAAELQTKLESQSASDISRTSDQLWSVSRIVLAKYRWVRLSVIAAGAGALTTSIAAVVVR